MSVSRMYFIKNVAFNTTAFTRTIISQLQIFQELVFFFKIEYLNRNITTTLRF